MNPDTHIGITMPVTKLTYLKTGLLKFGISVHYWHTHQRIYAPQQPIQTHCLYGWVCFTLSSLLFTYPTPITLFISIILFIFAAICIISTAIPPQFLIFLILFSIRPTLKGFIYICSDFLYNFRLLLRFHCPTLYSGP